MGSIFSANSSGMEVPVCDFVSRPYQLLFISLSTECLKTSSFQEQGLCFGLRFEKMSSDMTEQTAKTGRQEGDLGLAVHSGEASTPKGCTTFRNRPRQGNDIFYHLPRPHIVAQTVLPYTDRDTLKDKELRGSIVCSGGGNHLGSHRLVKLKSRCELSVSSSNSIAEFVPKHTVWGQSKYLLLAPLTPKHFANVSTGQRPFVEPPGNFLLVTDPQKSFCYIPIVSSVTLWKKGSSHTSPSPRAEKAVLPCSRFLTHMKNFSASHKTDKLHFLPFPGFIEGTPSPMTDNGLLYTPQYIIPNSPGSTVSFEEVYGEACPSLSPTSETDEDDLFSTVKDRRQKQLRGSPKQAWTSPFLEKPAADKPLKRSYTIFLEAAGRHIPLQNHPLGKSKGDSGPGLRPFTAIGLCKSVNQSCSSPKISCRTASESEQQDKMSSSGSWTNTDSLSICGSALGRPLAATTPGMTPKHSHRPTECRSKAASAFRGHAAKEPLPLLVGSSTHLFPKKLMKVCSSAAPRPPQGFHTACSQTLSRPVVTAHLH
ncbi:uncharacterized protein C12orf42 homolog [Microtus pennsylvanicus]|uniref:uncharacterized protein C12orf42 homolog n=1 Tax=Microtus pennsylvanicus TaxID=10058 RepID=UPI003F6D48D2